jgi:ATP-binding protein involved in chromosome partitioning
MPLKMYGNPQSQDGLENVRQIIGVIGGKGGVGKSTVTVNLALALKLQKRRVGILDADIYGPSVVHLLGGGSLPKTEGDRIFPSQMRGLSVMSVSCFQEEQAPLIVRAPIANGFIDQFLQRVNWGHLDDLLIDFPPGTGDIQITLMQKARLTGVVIVTTPQELALLDVRKSVQMAEKMGVPLLGIIENMSYFLHEKRRYALFGEGGGKQLADECGVPLLGNIPLDAKLSRLSDEGESLFETEALSRESFQEAAARLEGRLKGCVR